jgi:hypothetical protein
MKRDKKREEKRKAERRSIDGQARASMQHFFPKGLEL